MKKYIALFLAVCACADMQDWQGGDGINQYVTDVGYLKVDPSSPKTEAPCDGMCPSDEQDGEFFCSYKRYNQTERFDQFVALQPNSSALFPGNMISGRAAKEGALTPLRIDLAPMTFSISLENLRSSPVARDVPTTLGDFREARNKMLAAGVTGATPAAIDLKIVQVHSLSQIGIELGVGVSWAGSNKVSAAFDFANNQQTTKILVDFVQSYYTIDINAPTTPVQFFADGVTALDLKRVSTPENPPLYIQSINYGRRVVFSVESDKSFTEINSAIKAAYENGIKGSGNVSFDYKKTLDTSTIRAFVLGGSGEDAVGVVAGFDGVVSFIKNGGEYNKDSPGSPISYKLAYLDNTVAQLAFSSDFAERTCKRNRGPLKLSIQSIQNTGTNDIKLNGSIRAFVSTPDNPMKACGEGEIVDLFYLDYDQYIPLPTGETWKPTNPDVQEVPSAEYGRGAEICLAGILNNSKRGDWFGGPDETLGEVYKTYYYGQTWNGLYSMTFRGSNNTSLDVIIKLSEE